MNKESEKVMRSQRRKKQHAVDIFGGKCQIPSCGYNKCIEALEFHHLDKDEKEEKPSQVILRWSFERAKKELDKCILVCANCHREIHAAEKKKKPIDLQIYYRPWLKKTCPCCSEDFETKSINQKFCTNTCYAASQRKVTRPSKEELKELLDSGITWVKLGAMFHLSDNGVRKWAKNYKLI
jgi:hypothetical protein